MSSTLSEPPAILPARRPVRRWLVGAAVALVCVPLVGWVWIGRHPHLFDDYYAQSDTAVNDGRLVAGEPTNSAWFVDASEGTFATVVRNDGRMPVTLVGSDPDRSAIETTVRFARVISTYDRFGPLVRSIVVQPGEEVEVVQSMLVCGTYSTGGAALTDGVRVTVRTWGVSVVRHLDVPMRYGFYARSGPLPQSDRCVERF